MIKHGFIKNGVIKHGLIKHAVIKHGDGLIKKNNVKRGSVGNTRLLPHAKKPLVPVFFSLTGRLRSGGKRFDRCDF